MKVLANGSSDEATARITLIEGSRGNDKENLEEFSRYFQARPTENIYIYIYDIYIHIYKKNEV